MEKVKCKECGKEINKKAEICPNCGCRVKSNTLKFIVICLIVIAIVVGGYYGAKYVKHQSDENKRLEKEKIESEKKDKLNKEETRMFETFLGKYKLSYNTELVNKELNDYTFVDEVSFEKKCYTIALGDTAEQEIVKENCINGVDFETITEYGGGYPRMFYIYKIDDNNAILNFQFQNVAKMDMWSDIMNNHLCFKMEDEDNLIQTECTKRKNGYSSYDDANDIDTKYEFKLTRVK